MTARRAWSAWSGVVLVAVVVGLAGCATVPGARRTPGGAARDPGPFPARAALETLGPAPAGEALSMLDVADVERWELAGPFPDRIGLSPAGYRGGFGAELQAFAKKRKSELLISADMECFARETGRFILERGTMPPAGLKRHIGGRCGSPGVMQNIMSLSGDVPARATEDEVLSHLRSRFGEMLASIPDGPETREAGVWFGRRGKKAILAVAVAELQVDLDPLPFAPDADGTVLVTGALRNLSGRLDALVSRGRFQYGGCQADPAVKLPRFSLRCAVDRGDPSAWVSLFVFPKDQVLGTTAMDLLVFPQGQGSTTYARPVLRAGPGAPEEDGARFTHLLNALRAEQGLAPVAFSQAESEVARKVAPHYFAALVGLAPRSAADTVALGILAGWEVEQVTRAAYFCEWMSSGDVGLLLAEMLEMPGARRTLFEPHVRALAFGAFRPAEHRVLGALVTTYAPFEEQPPGVEAKQVMDALNRARAERGLGPAELVVLPADTRAEMDQALARGDSPADAMHAVLQHVANRTGQGVSGGVMEAGMLEGLPFPEELLQRSSPVVFVTVTHYRPRGLPWGWYVVVLAYTAQGGQTASLEPATPPAGPAPAHPT